MLEPSTPSGQKTSRTWGRFARLVAIFAGAIALFSVLMILTYALPSARIESHVAESVPQLKADGLAYTPMFRSQAYLVDTFTDAIMLDIALRQDRDIVDAAFGGYHGSVEAEREWSDPIGALELAASGNRFREHEYARYWHGYLVFLRPALMFLDYGEIRYLNVLTLGALAIALASLMSRKIGGPAAGMFILSLLLTGFYITPFSIQLSTMPYLMLVACLALVAFTDEAWFRHADIEFFLIVGMLTSFLDLLTAPLLTLGMPLSIALLMRVRQGTSTRDNWVFTGSVIVSWCLGYLGAWLAKWALAWVALDSNQIAIAARQVAVRTGVGGGPSQILGAVWRNVRLLFPLFVNDGVGLVDGLVLNPRFLPLVFLGVLAICTLILFRKPWPEFRRYSPLVAPLILPYLWFAVASNHSGLHPWMTYRIQAMAILAAAILSLGLFDCEKFRAIGSGRGHTAGSGD